MSRFVVTKLEGDLMPRLSGLSRPVGVSFHVIDTAVNHELIATYRTEIGGNRTAAQAREHAEKSAREHAARLNG